MSSELLPESHRASSFMKTSTVIRAIIYFGVAPNLFSGRQRTQKQSHCKTKRLPLQVWQGSLWGDSLILHVQMNATSSSCHTRKRCTLLTVDANSPVPDLLRCFLSVLTVDFLLSCLSIICLLFMLDFLETHSSTNCTTLMFLGLSGIHTV